MPAITIDDIHRMRDGVFFEGPETARRMSRFWVLLTLAAIIASAGVVGDSTATVIGAMIVAPLMTPILGTMLALTLADRDNLMRCVGLVLAGAAAAIAIGFVIGVFVPYDVVAASNSQVAARVHPRLIDLIAALATGVVGSVALVRRDISDTLPGVAIAISLVPPLTVVGLTAEAGAWGQSGGALLLFTTNVAAILASGTVVMALYRVYRTAAMERPAGTRSISRRKGFALVVALASVIVVVLAVSSISIARDTAKESTIERISRDWAALTGWTMLDVASGPNKVTVRFVGPLPIPDTAELSAMLRADGVDVDDIVAELIPEARVALGGANG